MSQGIELVELGLCSDPGPSNRPLQMWQGIQSDPSSNDSDEYMSASSNNSDEYMSASSNDSDEYMSASSNPRSEVQSPEIQSVPSSNHFNRPLPDLLHASNYDRYVNIGLPLYEASIKCDWKAAEAILDKKPDMNLLRCSITENGETALHIAASAKAPKKVDEFVRNLVGKMEMEDLELLNNNKSTALYLAAAAGNIETVEIMMKKHETLDTIPGGGGEKMPLYAAVLFGNKDVARYLYYECPGGLKDDHWTEKRRALLLEKCVESDMFDIAVDIVNNDPKLGTRSNFLYAKLLGLLARKPEALLENKSSNPEFNIIRRTIKSGKHPY